MEEKKNLLEGSESDSSTQEAAPYRVNLAKKRNVQYGRLPWGTWVLEKIGFCNCKPSFSYKFMILFLTFWCYTSYHLSRKPFSVVKVVLCPSCANSCNGSVGWEPFNDPKHGKAMLGGVDYSYLFAYAIGMFFSGQIADRVNLRYFLTIGMIGSGITVGLVGVGYFAKIHHLYYFILVQIIGGFFQSTGWPGTVAVMGHWFGKNNRGFIMGVWNSHTSVGNILGTIIPSFWADCDGSWGWSFIVPGAIIIGIGIILYFFLVNDPRYVGLPPPVHHTREERERTPTPALVDDNGEPVVVDENDEEKSEMNPRIVNHNSIQASTKRLQPKGKAIDFLGALKIPGVIEFSLALFFNKLVAYTFLYWLPLYVQSTNANLSGPESDWLSTLFDVGGILGGIAAGIISDRLKARAIICVIMLVLAIPSLFVFRTHGGDELGVYITLLIVCGVFVNGPYAMITTAVSSDLGTHPSLQGNLNAKATVTAIIDGTGSIGAALGPLIIGVISSEANWNPAFYFLMCSLFVSALMLARLVYGDIVRIVGRCRSSRYDVLK